jgi:23S rRNA (uridine2552-2'-O)-methyltransferase
MKCTLPSKQAHHKKDGYYQQAKKEGYRARSAYKLLDIQKRYNIFKRAFYILDLGCAPGSWLQVAKKYAEDNLNKYNDQYYYRDHYKILGIDIKSVSPIDDIQILKMDFTTPGIENEINFYFQKKIDLLSSDASINKTGNKFSDHLNQVKLCSSILELAKTNLKYKGNIVMKTFQGEDFPNLIGKVKVMFRLSKAFKPTSSKKKSNEIYIIGLQKK